MRWTSLKYLFKDALIAIDIVPQLKKKSWLVPLFCKYKVRKNYTQVWIAFVANLCSARIQTNFWVKMWNLKKLNWKHAKIKVIAKIFDQNVSLPLIVNAWIILRPLHCTQSRPNQRRAKCLSHLAQAREPLQKIFLFLQNKICFRARP